MQKLTVGVFLTISDFFRSDDNCDVRIRLIRMFILDLDKSSTILISTMNNGFGTIMWGVPILPSYDHIT